MLQSVNMVLVGQKILKFYFYFYENKWIDQIKRNDLIKARNLCNIFTFNKYLDSTNDGEEFEVNYCNIYPNEFEFRKENIQCFLDLDIKIRNAKFLVGLFNKRDSFPIFYC